MKNLLRLLVLTFAVAVPALAQDEAKTKAYTDFYNAVQANKQDDAYRIGKEYLGKYGTETDQYTTYVKATVEGYEKGQRLGRIDKVIRAVSVADPKQSNFNEAFTQGKQILQTEPENLNVLINLGYGGYMANASNNSAFNADAINYARKAVALIESGRTPEDPYPTQPAYGEYYPFKNRDEALGYLNFALGELALKSNPKEAAQYFTKAVQFNTPVKSSPVTYVRIADAYVASSDYARKAEQFLKTYNGQPESDASKAAQAELFGIIDPIMDAHARVIAYSGSDPNYQKVKQSSTQIVTQLYEFRNGSTTGLDTYLTGVTSKPLPQPGAVNTTAAPTTTTPTATPVATPMTSTPPAAAAGRSASPSGTTMVAPGAATTTTGVRPAAATAPRSTTNKPAAATPAKTPTKPQPKQSGSTRRP